MRRLSTIDGYRTAIIDPLGPAGQHISQSSDLNRFLSSFHRDRPKSSRNLPKWNLPVVLNELTKAPFEPMKSTDLKHLTLFRRIEIHAWVANICYNQVFRSLISGSRYMFTSGYWVRSLSLLMCICIMFKDFPLPYKK